MSLQNDATLKHVGCSRGTGQGQGSAAWPEPGGYWGFTGTVWYCMLLYVTVSLSQTDSDSTNQCGIEVDWDPFTSTSTFQCRWPPRQSWPVQSLQMSKMLWEVRRMSLTRIPYLGRQDSTQIPSNPVLLILLLATLWCTVTYTKGELSEAGAFALQLESLELE